MAAAGLAEEPSEDELAEMQEVDDGSIISRCKQWFLLTGGLDYTSHYFHRGYLLQRGGLIFQPYRTLALRDARDDGIEFLPYVSLWQSFDLDGSEEFELPAGAAGNLHAHHGAAQMGAHTRLHSNWYQFELFGGAITTVGDLVVDLKYMLHGAPSGAFSGVQEIGGRASYDLAGLWSEPDVPRTFGVRPYLAMYFETRDHRGSEDAYLEFGFEPYLRTELCGRRVGVALPVAFGLSLDDYYFNDLGEEQGLGFFSLGLQFSTALGVPERWGSWYATAALKYVHLAADNLIAVAEGTSDTLVGQLGLSFAY